MINLIDADKFKEENKELLDCEIEHSRIQVTLRQLIDEAPVIGYLRGEWILTDNMNYSPFDGSSPTVKTCSVCKFKYSDKRIFNFCPNCRSDNRGDST